MTSKDDAFFDAAASKPRGARSPLQVAPNFAPPKLEEQVKVAQQVASAPVTDALLQCLVWLTNHHGRPRSPESLRAGQPVDGPLMPDQALRLMKDAGYNAGLLAKRIADISPLLLPAVLLLGEGDACVLTRRLEADSGRPEDCRYEVVFPDGAGQPAAASAEELSSSYSGFVLVATLREQAASGKSAESVLNPHTSHWLWGTMRRFLPYYRASMVAALLSNVLLLVIGLVTSVIFDKVIPHQALTTLWTLSIGAFIALSFDLFARTLRSHLIDLAGRKTDLIIGARLFRQALGVRMEHKPESAGSYAHYMAQIELVRDFFASASLSALSDLPFIVIFIAMTFVVAGDLGWVLVAAVPIVLGIAIMLQSHVRKSVFSNMREQADLHGTLIEAVEGLEDLKTSGAQGRFMRRFESSTAVAAESALKMRTVTALTNNLSMTAQQLITLIMLVWGVYLIQDGHLTAGGLIGGIMFASRALGPLSGIVGVATRYQGARAALQSLDAMMKAPQERDPERAYVPMARDARCKLRLHDVGFSYPLPTGVEGNAPKVLKAVSLSIEPGERIAVLGRIGSGKSTILRLLAGLYQPTEGAVEIDGIDMRQIDPAEFRAHLGFVNQEPRLFNGTLRDNVSMGRPDVDAARLAQVSRVTGLDRLISAHPQGWDLGVGEMGGLLSGGQRQMVALARALVHQPDVLLMDEPTSSMDAQSELAFLRQLRDAAPHCTLVVVTHRPAVLELVQRIVVVDNGRIVMDGPRDAVLAALSGAKPAQAPSGDDEKVRHHPSAQPVGRQQSV